MPPTRSRYRYVRSALGENGGKRWFWQAHGENSKWMRTETQAARALAATLCVPLTDLLIGRRGTKQVAFKRSSHRGVFWHRGKLGWVVRSGAGGAHFTEEEACKAGRIKMATRRASSAKARIRRRSHYKHVIWHNAKKARRFFEQLHWQRSSANQQLDM